MKLDGIEEEKPLDHSLDQLDRYEFVRQAFGMGKTRFSEMVNDPHSGMPLPVKLNGTSLAWIRSEWVAHLRSLPRVQPSRKPRKPPFTGLAGTTSPRKALSEGVKTLRRKHRQRVAEAGAGEVV